MEWAEHERERVLRDELIRQEKLEQMARRFDRKAAMRETWLLENQKLVAQVNCVAYRLWTNLGHGCFLDIASTYHNLTISNKFNEPLHSRTILDMIYQQ